MTPAQGDELKRSLSVLESQLDALHLYIGELVVTSDNPMEPLLSELYRRTEDYTTCVRKVKRALK